MDKKNTMLLTVIAVATLLVAVVGATFAYFSVTVKGDESTSTSVTGSTSEAPGTVTFATANANLSLKVSAADMAKTNQGKKYYAIAGQTGRGESEIPVNIFSASVTGGPDGQKYSCKGNVKVALSGTMPDALKLNESKLKLEGFTSSSASSSLDQDLSEAESEYNIPDATFIITQGTPLNVTALLYLENTTSDQTSDLAEKELNVAITLEEGVTCEPIA